VTVPVGRARHVVTPSRLAEAIRETARRRAILLMGLVTIALVVGGQLAEDLLDDPALQLLPPTLLRQRWTVIAVVVYLLFVVEVVRREAREALADLRPVVRIDDRRFEVYRAAMTGLHPRVEIALAAASLLLVIVLFPIAGVALPTADIPGTDTPLHLPASPLPATVIVLAYAALGWAGLRLVEMTIRVALTLGRLTRESVAVRVFDTADLLPFGHIALAAALAPAGLIAIFVLGLGAPRSALGWAVLLLATATSLLALVLPLRGIHGQMRRAKDEALAGLNGQLSDVHALVGSGPPADGATVPSGELNDRTSLLVSLRRVVSEMPTWPFRDTVVFGRAVLIASAPVIYAALNGLVDAFVVKRIAP
jgi:hypothetical protein